MIIELDGAVHLGQEHKDMRRQRWLESEGFRVLRFKNTEVFLEMEVVLGEILRVCERRR